MSDAPHLVVPGWARDLGLHAAETLGPDGTRLRFWVGGAADGPRVLFLHGFPQNAGAWRRVARLLVGDHRLVIPDLRGYGESEIAASGHYDLETLVLDVAAVEGATRREGESPGSALLVAHDWGGPIAWQVAHRRPDLLRGLVACNAPHGGAYARQLRTKDQAKRSWYTAVFQIPFFERALTAGGGRALRFVFERSAPPELLSPEEIDEYVLPLLRPGRAAAALAYYRAAARALATDRAAVTEQAPHAVPTIIVWGQNDAALSRSHPDACRAYATDLEIRRLDGVSHWVPEQAPEAVARAVRDLDARTR